MHHWFQLLIIIFVILSIAPFLGVYMAAAFGDKDKSSPVPFRWLERFIYKVCGIVPEKEMTWKTYAKALLYFNGLGIFFLFFLQVFQQWLPLNPQNFSMVKPDLALNTAVSFVTNTSWQAYGGEVTMSYFTQMVGLTVQNFVSAATGNSALLVLIRGFTRKSMATIGNFWADLVRTVVYLLLPLSIMIAFFLVGEGVIQNFKEYLSVETLSGEKQIIPMGPAASQIAIKQLGTNGGGFFNANSAHPFENPTPLSNIVETIAILLIPVAAVFMYGHMIKEKRQSRLLFAVMTALWISSLAIALFGELLPNANAMPPLEGKEMRFGTVKSVLWAVSTTATSNGSVNAMNDSLSPLAGAAALFNMIIGEVAFGGVGVGLCSMLMFVLLTVFLAGLMVGRTPEYLGKKIEKGEMQWVMLAILGPCALILLGVTIAFYYPEALKSLKNFGPHGLSEMLYAYTSAASNNGSAFAGLNADTPFFNSSLALVMLFGRLAILLPSLAIGGSLAEKKGMVPSLGTLETDKCLFGLLLLSVIIILGALTFFPAFTLGPIVEQILLQEGRTF